MGLRRHPQAVVISVFALATVAALGPHLLMLGYYVAGAQPPAAILLFCPLHHLLEQQQHSHWALHAKPLT
jgi:hypothetical protein